MAWHNDKERGVRLGWTTTLGLFVSCTRCSHGARIRLDTALRLWGERAFMRDIARDLRCTRCGARAACANLIADPRPSWKIDEDPGGGFALGPTWAVVATPLSPATRAVRARGWSWFS